MKNSFTISVVLPTGPEAVYDAWLSSEGHTAFTGSEASVEPGPSGTFMAWDGYISGKTLKLEPYRRIVQSWRTTDFPPDADDSTLEIVLTPVEGGTRLTLRHRSIPEGQADGYKQGWKDYYFAPMLDFFSARGDKPR